MMHSLFKVSGQDVDNMDSMLYEIAKTGQVTLIILEDIGWYTARGSHLSYSFLKWRS